MRHSTQAIAAAKPIQNAPAPRRATGLIILFFCRGMSSSCSSDEDFMPVGISLLNINKKATGASVMAQPVEEEDGLIPALRYHTLLTAAFEALNKTGEEEQSRIKLPLQVLRKSRKTFINVVEVATRLHRQPEHLAHFISKSLFADGTINKDGSLVLPGAFLQSNVERALRNFIEIYVVCKSCDSVDDTEIVKESKLFFLRCERCKARRCVGNAIEGLSSKDKANPKLRGLV
ncbi:translation initiation factor 2 subunit 2 [Pancytospora philotis]|nr:translation initiation factor 2 subunit 2 [Pancytospora philotis]